MDLLGHGYLTGGFQPQVGGALPLNAITQMDSTMKNWISNTKINALLEAGSQKFDGVKVKRDLIEYCDRYQKIYPFEILEEPLNFLINNVSSDDKYREMHALLRIAAEEYCISLNEISEALLDLIDTRVLATDQAKKIINHLFEAFSCNEKPEDFIPREDAYLCKKLFATASS
ncbi:hypothetical protein C4K03_3419 [Pseudomonas synxantha]|uniref:Uncharacterized protein n=2 Tax=Pseudomonas synxantha TaxID=47883 RepID=A0A3G7UAA0_9PSED|nr:hypothetical protein C4K03_3419 [Pseudomonas synxantha]